MTLTRSKVKVTELVKLWKLHFSKSISSAIFTWSSKLMVDHDSMGPSLHLAVLAGARFSNFLLRKISHEFKLCGCQYYMNFKWPYFPNAWGYGHMVGHAGSPICIAQADMTLTWSKVKVKVTDLLKFCKLHFSTLTSPEFIAFCLPAGRGYKLVIVIAHRPQQARACWWRWLSAPLWGFLVFIIDVFENVVRMSCAIAPV